MIRVLHGPHSSCSSDENRLASQKRLLVVASFLFSWETIQQTRGDTFRRSNPVQPSVTLLNAFARFQASQHLLESARFSQCREQPSLGHSKHLLHHQMQ